MKLSKEELLEKFPVFKKYEGSEWLDRLVLRGLGSLKDIPFSLCEILLNDLRDFCEETKFGTRWEECHSTKIRVEQMLHILKDVQHQ